MTVVSLPDVARLGLTGYYRLAFLTDCFLTSLRGAVFFRFRRPTCFLRGFKAFYVLFGDHPNRTARGFQFVSIPKQTSPPPKSYGCIQNAEPFSHFFCCQISHVANTTSSQHPRK